MSIEGFAYKDQFLGTGDQTAYTFDFKIFDPSHLHIYIQDNVGNILNDTDGTDPGLISSVTFDSIEGGGTINLVAVLPNNYVMSIYLANDYPDQPTDFPNKASFTLDAIEGGLDFLAACVQRVAYLAQRAVRLHDLDDIDGFDMRLPINLSSFPGASVNINSLGNGWALGPTEAQLMAIVDAEAVAAVTAALSAVLSHSAIHTGPFAAIAPNASLDLPGELTDQTKFTMVDFVARIQRGTTVYARQEFSIFYRSGAWEIAIGPDRYADAGADHGITFSVNSVTGQITASVANDGGSNAVIDLDKIQWPT